MNLQSLRLPQDQTLLAVIFASLNVMFISCMNLFAKLLGDYFPPEQITFCRNIVSLSLLVIGLIAFRKLGLCKTKRIKAHILRALLGTAGMFLVIWTYTIMPMTNAATLLFTQPLWVVVLSYPLLREKVGLYRSLAILVGFLGVLVVATPENGFTAYGLAVGLSAGLVTALVVICLRWIGKTENPATSVFYFLMFGSFIMAPLLPITGKVPAMADVNVIVLIALALGVFGLGSLLCKTYSYCLGSAALIAPINYTTIIWACSFDYFIWGTLPKPTLLTGAGIIIASNLFILWRERKKKPNSAEAPA